jgi:hypothetical protein
MTSLRALGLGAACGAALSVLIVLRELALETPLLGAVMGAASVAALAVVPAPYGAPERRGPMLGAAVAVALVGWFFPVTTGFAPAAVIGWVFAVAFHAGAAQSVGGRAAQILLALAAVFVTSLAGASLLALPFGSMMSGVVLRGLFVTMVMLVSANVSLKALARGPG